jgi:glycosyltransferase involved in cell wall biosynthesis
MTKLVSVIIPAYNQSCYLSDSIQSVLNQTYRNFEIIVVDDGSTDDTAAVAKSFGCDCVHYIYQDNKGLSSARNTGIRHSKGEYLTYLDSDDQFLPEKLEILVNVLEDNPNIGFAAGQAIPIDEQGNLIGETFAVPLPDDSSQLLLGNPLHVGSVLLHYSWQEKVGFFDEELRSYEDWDMWLRLARAGCPMIWVARPVSLYRFHRHQMTRQGTQMTMATFAVLDKHFADRTLPESWKDLRDIAWSNAHLRAAMQAYTAQDFSTAEAHMLEACCLNPDLVAREAEQISKRLAAFAWSPKNPDPIRFMETIYNHLPDELEILRQRRDRDIGRVAIDAGFKYYYSGKHKSAHHAIVRAIRYQPKWLTNRGVVSVLARSIILHLFMSPGRVNSSG